MARNGAPWWSLRATTLPGAPEGDYEVLGFQTVFENRELIATETIIMARSDDGWDVTGFFIR